MYMIGKLTKHHGFVLLITKVPGYRNMEGMSLTLSVISSTSNFTNNPMYANCSNQLALASLLLLLKCLSGLYWPDSAATSWDDSVLKVAVRH